MTFDNWDRAYACFAGGMYDEDGERMMLVIALTQFFRDVADWTSQQRALHLITMHELRREQSRERPYEPRPLGRDDAALDAEYAAHEAAGRCGDCEMGTYPHYGVAPHGCFYKIGAPFGGSIVHPRETWPANFREDPDEPGCGVYECPRCSVKP
jgi:hypothetical protein